jgi:uncharacterized Zn-binding protein involved in type VI secretion
MSAAVRVGDKHVCSLTAPIPHVGGSVQAPGVPTVLIGNQPAATRGAMCPCALGLLPNAIVGGSTTVLIGNNGAARVDDPTAHGGQFSAGCPTVLIGG